ncbi:hypothetical protein B0A48_03796 [Cryoendolithus antarcticus]|uniref:Uncharacterized protein n=1 Tax=Cryoendolithus antarcticus TaxID=1507870 RepID=A0A1V8TGJ5_9PEZI|nr:hypothetical protein B0A48_03796 [Cryoendolithus antarcticus]
MSLFEEYGDTNAPSIQLYNPLLQDLLVSGARFRWPIGNKHSAAVCLDLDMNIEVTVFARKHFSDLMDFTKGDSWRRTLCAELRAVCIDIFIQGFDHKKPPLLQDFCDYGVELGSYATMGDMVDCVLQRLEDFVESLTVAKDSGTRLNIGTS